MPDAPGTIWRSIAIKAGGAGLFLPWCAGQFLATSLKRSSSPALHGFRKADFAYGFGFINMLPPACCTKPNQRRSYCTHLSPSVISHHFSLPCEADFHQLQVAIRCRTLEFWHRLNSLCPPGWNSYPRLICPGGCWSTSSSTRSLTLD